MTWTVTISYLRCDPRLQILEIVSCRTLSIWCCQCIDDVTVSTLPHTAVVFRIQSFNRVL